MKSFVVGNNTKDICNEDKTACFYRALLDKTLAERKKECKGGKMPKKANHF